MDDMDAPELLRHLTDHLLPLLLLSSLSAAALPSRWRLLHSKLSHLLSLLSSLSPFPSRPHHPLLLHLLPNLLCTLDSLSSLSARCSEPSALAAGKLLLQSDLDIATNLLSIHIHDLDLLIKSGTLLHRSDAAASGAGAIVLSVPGPTSTRSDVILFIRDAFARIQIGALDLKQNALDSLRELIASYPAKISLLIAQEGDVSAIIRLLDPASHSLIRDQAAAVVSVLATASEVSRRAVFEEGGLGPLFRLMEGGSAAVKEHAAAAAEAVTADQSNGWAVLAYGGVGVLVSACRSGGGSPLVRALAAGSLKNVAAVEDLRVAMVEEGAVAVLVDLVVSGTSLAQKNAAVCLWSLASEGGDEVRARIFQEGGLDNLVHLVRESQDPEILEHGLRAIQVLLFYGPAARSLSMSRPFFAQLAELINFGNVSIQQICACLISSLSPNEEIKRSMAGCMPSMIKMMELPKPASAQEAAAVALVCLLAVRTNRLELGGDVKSMSKLVQMLDPKREEIYKKFPVSVVLALASSGGCRKSLNEWGACQQLQKLASSDVAGAKKALRIIAGSRLKNIFSMSWRECQKNSKIN